MKHEIDRKHPFPERCPSVEIEEVSRKAFVLDCRELRWWSIIPEMGQRSFRGEYQPSGGALSCVREMQVTRCASIHKQDCLEIAVHEWTPGCGWLANRCFLYARLTKDLVEFVAEIVSRQDRISVYTFLDEGFDVDWGQIRRKIRGKVVSKDLTLEENSQPGMPAIAIGAGRYRVQIGSRVFPCFRVIDAASGECGEAFLDKHGRTICCRMYSVKGEGEASIQVNGTKFRHQYNWFTNLAFE
jgi:hypothetical protein